MEALELNRVVEDFFSGLGKKITDSKEWHLHNQTRTTKKYWWNWFLADGQWTPVEVYPNRQVIIY